MAFRDHDTTRYIKVQITYNSLPNPKLNDDSFAHPLWNFYETVSEQIQRWFATLR